MPQRLKALLLIFLLAFPAPLYALSALPSLNIMADSSLSMAITLIARSYSRERNIAVNTSYISPRLQQELIAEGAAADILITSMEDGIETLKMQGMIDIYSQTPIAKNRLVLIAAATDDLESSLLMEFPLTEIIKRIGYEPGFVIGSPDALLEGIYAKEALRSMNVAADLEPYTLYLKSSTQMLDMVANSGAYGVAFNSSIYGKHNLRAVDLFPETTHHPIQYYAVVLAGDNMNEARRFMEFLTTPKAKNILLTYGFFVD